MRLKPLTAQEQAGWPEGPMVSLEAPHEDARGAIQPLVDLPMDSAMLITSKRGTVRANHYHRTDWHYCYLLSGEMEYHYRPHGSDEPPRMVVVRKGQMVFTPPLLDHAMRFTADTVFLTLSRNPRDQASYEADVVRISLIET
jgi:oxalate decarboxylase/phosphoglucose isomerase-like protein (cupin superfamily)